MLKRTISSDKKKKTPGKKITASLALVAYGQTFTTVLRKLVRGFFYELLSDGDEKNDLGLRFASLIGK